ELGGAPPTTVSTVAAMMIGREPETLRRLEELQTKLTRIEDEISLWSLRVDIALRKGDMDLSHEAQAMAQRMEASARTLRDEIARLRGTPGTAAPVPATPPDPTAQPAAPTPPASIP